MSDFVIVLLMFLFDIFILFQLTYRYTVDKPPEFAIILAFLAGCVELAMGVLKLGKCFIHVQQYILVSLHSTCHLARFLSILFENQHRIACFIHCMMYILR